MVGTKKIKFLDILIAFFALIRAKNLVILAFSQIVIAVFWVDTQNVTYANILNSGFWLVITATLFTAASGYIINDYFDVKIDLINKPDRVVVGRTFSRRQILVLHWLLSISGTLLGAWAHIGLLPIFFATSTLLWVYSAYLKRQPATGNLLVAILTSVSLIMPALYFDSELKQVFAIASFVFFINLIREIIKDLEDMRGDSVAGANTLAILLGLRRTKLVIYLIMVAALVSYSIIAYFSDWRFLTFTVFSLIYFSVLFFLLLKADKVSQFAKASLWCKYYMLAGIVLMVALKLVTF